MKKIFVSAIALILSASAFAADVAFLEGNEIPSSLKNKIEAELISRCGKALEFGNIFWEQQTDVRIDRVDQGVVDLYFTTEFMIAMKDDPFHFDSFKIVVKSEQMAGSNPSPDAFGRVTAIESEDGLCN